MKKTILSICFLKFMALSLSGCAVMCEEKRYKEKIRPLVRHYCNNICREDFTKEDKDLEHRLRCISLGGNNERKNM